MICCCHGFKMKIIGYAKLFVNFHKGITNLIKTTIEFHSNATNEKDQTTVVKNKQNAFYKKRIARLGSHSCVPPYYRSKFSYFVSRYHLRSQLNHFLHKICHSNGYCEIDPPLLTSRLRDLEHETMLVENSTCENDEKSFFDNLVYLSTSKQLHLDCMTSGLSKVYSIGPTVRADNTSGKKMYEFWTLDVEETYNASPDDGFNSLMTFVEFLLKEVLHFVSTNVCNEAKISDEALELVEKCRLAQWPRLMYGDAISTLNNSEFKVTYLPIYDGMKFYRTYENILTEHYGGMPIFITHLPMEHEAFNTAGCSLTNRSFSFDLIFPHTGELATGALRENDSSVLDHRLESSDYHRWFTDTRKWGVAPSKGFSLGIDRLLHFIFKEVDIKNVVPFPRTRNFCAC